MKIVTSNKTMEAIKLAHETWAYIVVMDRVEASRVFRLAEEMGQDINFPITFDELLSGAMSRSRIKNVIIDNADHLLRYLCRGLNIQMITLDMEGK